jgi:hypothetical protein
MRVLLEIANPDLPFCRSGARRVFVVKLIKRPIERRVESAKCSRDHMSSGSSFKVRNARPAAGRPVRSLNLKLGCILPFVHIPPRTVPTRIDSSGRPDWTALHPRSPAKDIGYAKNRLYIRPNATISHTEQSTTAIMILTEYYGDIESHAKKNRFKNQHLRRASKETLRDVAEARCILLGPSKESVSAW